MREIIIMRPGLFIACQTAGFFLLIIAGRIIGKLYDRKHSAAKVDQQYREIKRLEKENSEKDEKIHNYSQRFKAIINLATTNGSVDD